MPLTAAALGLGYWSALPSVILALRTPRWSELRILPVMALVLTTVIMLATLRDLDAFHLREGPLLGRIAAWAWLILYALLPPLNLAAFVLQERHHGDAISGGHPLIPWVRALLMSYAVGFTSLGFGLLFAAETFGELWPWPLTRLTAGAVGGFVVTLATGCRWGLRERDWMGFRLAVPFLLIWFVAQFLAAILHRTDFDGAASGLAYVGVLMASFALFGLAARQHGAQAGGNQK